MAARFKSTGAGKSGKPCARLTAPYRIARRDISRITDSVKRAVRSLWKFLRLVEMAPAWWTISSGLVLFRRAFRGYSLLLDRGAPGGCQGLPGGRGTPAHR